MFEAIDLSIFSLIELPRSRVNQKISFWKLSEKVFIIL